MAISWFQLTGGTGYGPTEPDFSGDVEARLWEAFPQLEAEVLSEYDGARWLLQGGYERVAVGLEFRAAKRGRQRRTVKEIGRLLMLDYSVAWPELATASVEEIREHLGPIVVDALAVVGAKKQFGALPRRGEGEGLPVVPLKPLVEDPTPYAEGPGDSFVITRELPPGLDPSAEAALLEQYENDLDRLLTKRAKSNIIEADTTATAVRWVIEVPRSKR